MNTKKHKTLDGNISLPDKSVLPVRRSTTTQAAGVTSGYKDVPVEKEKEKVPETYQDYYELQKKYAKEYADRGEFKYDVNADEIYKIYREQAEKNAKSAQRHTTAQAAGLTGGYGSSYAAAAGAQAYSDVMDDVDAMIPELYEAARARYDREGEDLLKRAETAGAYGDMLYMESDDYTADLQAAADAETYKRVNTLGDTQDLNVYDTALKDFVGGNQSKEELITALMKWKYKDTGEGAKNLTYEDAEYLARTILNKREHKGLLATTNSVGMTLSDYINTHLDGETSFEEAYAALEAWSDADGNKLSEEQILLILNGN